MSYIFIFSRDIYITQTGLPVLCEILNLNMMSLCQGFSRYYHAKEDLHLKNKDSFDQFTDAVNNCTNILSPVLTSSVFIALIAVI